MNYTVLWLPSAEAQLGEILAAAADPDDVVRTLWRADALFGYVPHQVGESRGPGERVFMEQGFTFFYQIDEEAQQVRVWSVRTRLSR